VARLLEGTGDGILLQPTDHRSCVAVMPPTSTVRPTIQPVYRRRSVVGLSPEAFVRGRFQLTHRRVCVAGLPPRADSGEIIQSTLHRAFVLCSSPTGPLLMQPIVPTPFEAWYGPPAGWQIAWTVSSVRVLEGGCVRYGVDRLGHVRIRLDSTLLFFCILGFCDISALDGDLPVLMGGRMKKCDFSLSWSYCLQRGLSFLDEGRARTSVR